jgi:hypothetical protein
MYRLKKEELNKFEIQHRKSILDIIASIAHCLGCILNTYLDFTIKFLPFLSLNVSGLRERHTRLLNTF